MPPPRRHRPAATPPSRRPKVAGLRKLTQSGPPAGRSSDDSTTSRGEETPEATAAPDTEDATPAASAGVAGADDAAGAAADVASENVADDGAEDTADPDGDAAFDPVEDVAHDPADEQIGSAGSADAVADEPGTGEHTADGADTTEVSSESVRTTPSPRPRGEGDSLRPSPRRKARDTGIAKPTDETEAIPKPAAPTSRPRPVPRTSSARGRLRRGWFRKTGYPLVVLLLTLTVLLAGAAVFFKVRHSEAATVTNNSAMVDVAATAEVKEAMTTAAERLFSLDYNNLAKTRKAADELLVGKKVSETYDKLMREIRAKAPEQKLVVNVTTARSGVIRLNEDRAKVMVYVDQTATRAGQKKQPSIGGSALWFRTERRDGQWKIVNMNTYAAPQGASPRNSGEPQRKGQPTSAPGQTGDAGAGNPPDQEKQGQQGSNGGSTEGN